MIAKPRLIQPALLMLLLVVPGLVEAAGAGGQDSSAGPVARFDIPAEPIDQALLAYSHVTGIPVVYDSSIVHGQRSSGVKGAFHAREALELLLRDTGLRVRYTSPTAVTLAPVADTPAPLLRLQPMRVEGTPQILDRTQLTSWAERAQSRIAALLSRDPTLRHLDFDITLRIRFASDGAIAQTILVASSATPDDTGRILTALAKIANGEPPPADLPQPVSFRFRSVRLN
jgi:hypothetical protein